MENKDLIIIKNRRSGINKLFKFIEWNIKANTTEVKKTHLKRLK